MRWLMLAILAMVSIGGVASPVSAAVSDQGPGSAGQVFQTGFLTAQDGTFEVDFETLLDDTLVPLASGGLEPYDFDLVSPPSHGLVTVNDNGTFTYLPVEGFSGADTFTYHINDSNGRTSNVATVTLNVAEPPATPTAEPTEEPTAVPTEVPTEEPTEVPTEEPTAVQTEQPTEVPTEAPTEVPTEVPTNEPTVTPAPATNAPEGETTPTQTVTVVAVPNTGAGQEQGQTGAYALLGLGLASLMALGLAWRRRGARL